LPLCQQPSNAGNRLADAERMIAAAVATRAGDARLSGILCQIVNLGLPYVDPAAAMIAALGQADHLGALVRKAGRRHALVRMGIPQAMDRAVVKVRQDLPASVIGSRIMWQATQLSALCTGSSPVFCF